MSCLPGPHGYAPPCLRGWWPPARPAPREGVPPPPAPLRGFRAPPEAQGSSLAASRVSAALPGAARILHSCPNPWGGPGKTRSIAQPGCSRTQPGQEAHLGNGRPGGAAGARGAAAASQCQRCQPVHPSAGGGLPGSLGLRVPVSQTTQKPQAKRSHFLKCPGERETRRFLFQPPRPGKLRQQRAWGGGAGNTP